MTRGGDGCKGARAKKAKEGCGPGGRVSGRIGGAGMEEMSRPPSCLSIFLLVLLCLLSSFSSTTDEGPSAGTEVMLIILMAPVRDSDTLR